MSPPVKLTYFNVTGRAEYIRYLLSYGGVDFIDERLTQEEFQARKPNLPFGKVPLLEIDGMTLYQSIVISRYLGSKFGLVPKDVKDAVQCETLGDTINDLRGLLRDIYFENNPEAKAQKKITNIAGGRYYLQKFNDIVKNNGGHFVNGQLTWTDFVFSAQAENFSVLAGEDMLSDYPDLKQLKEKVQSLPGVKKYLDNAPKPIF